MLDVRLDGSKFGDGGVMRFSATTVLIQHHQLVDFFKRKSHLRHVPDYDKQSTKKVDGVQDAKST
ncbi:hypothetical protein ACFPOU_16060 [Massilia jejuensis]|uniref:Uncharacterized protein n=1 Tax=Massilia jejuensis TaxID=648894 RepID=A0ABW0PKM8_9BURK